MGIILLPLYSEMIIVRLEDKLKRLPEQPGVYLMKNAQGKIIYVGKAKVLKNRVRQYFTNIEKHAPKVAAMVSNIADFEYIITDTETEAFVLECNLIKKFRPHYNILLKDDKRYPYIKVTMQDAYPTISLARKADDPKARFFGPYISSATVNHTIELVRKIFHVPHCRKKFPRDIAKERPCLYFSMGRCSAPCQNAISQKDYYGVFEEVCEFLSGNHSALLKRLESDMKAASQALEYEKAASIRDRILAINNLSEKQKVSSTTKRNIDIFALAVGEKDSVVELLYIREGNVSGSETFTIRETSDIESSDILDSFVTQYYNQTQMIPDLVLLPETFEDIALLEAFLHEKKGKTVSVRVPRKGDLLDLMGMAQKNAKNALENHAPGMAERKELRILEELQKTVGLSVLPRRIEAYDISHISGSNSVAAGIVFQDGKPARSKYIRMKIKYNDGNNDYESMREVLYRRFSRMKKEPDNPLFAQVPDLILIDGGKGQLNAASAVLNEFQLNIPVLGMVKDEKHRTRGLVSEDGEVEVLPFGTVFRFISAIQDEVHKTAIAYHRSTREKSATKSVLTEIEGIGPGKAATLMKKFRSIDKIKRASVAELSEVKGIGVRDAEKIHHYFHPF